MVRAHQVNAPVLIHTTAKSWIILCCLRKPVLHIYLMIPDVIRKSHRVLVPAMGSINWVGGNKYINEHPNTRRASHRTCEHTIQGSNLKTTKGLFQLSLGGTKSTRTGQSCTLRQHIFSHFQSNLWKYVQVPQTGEVGGWDKAYHLSDKLTKSRNRSSKLQQSNIRPWNTYTGSWDWQ